MAIRTATIGPRGKPPTWLQQSSSYGSAARNLLIKAKNGDVKINQPEYQKLQDAYSLYLHTVGWYFSDYSKGVHDPSGFEKTSSEVIKNLRTATAAAQNTIK